MRILGLDLGDKTIGIALSDELFLAANGREIYARTDSWRKDCDYILDLVRAEEISEIVLGLPLNLDGSDSVQTEKVRDFKTKLENKLRSNRLQKVPVVFQDERFTTKIAEAVMLEADLSRARRKELIDKQAAVIILQSYLDGKRRQEGS